MQAYKMYTKLKPILYEDLVQVVYCYEILIYNQTST